KTVPRDGIAARASDVRRARGHVIIPGMRETAPCRAGIAARRHDIGARSMHAMKSKADIDATVARLAERLRELCTQLPPAQVLEAFSREAAPLTEQVPAEHEAYVEERIHSLLSDAGLIPDDSPGG